MAATFKAAAGESTPLAGESAHVAVLSTAFGCTQVQRTTDNITEAGRTAWSTARRSTNKALQTPRSLLNAFGGRKAPYRLHDAPNDEDWLQEQEDANGSSDSLHQGLLQQSERKDRAQQQGAVK